MNAATGATDARRQSSTDPSRDVPVWVALSATPHRIEYVQVGPWRTRVLQAGPQDGEPLILMAGTGGHLEAYAHNIAAFADRYRVVAYDYPGHGYTTHATADLELPDYEEHLLGLLDALGIDAANLNGESLGGWVAVKFAAAHPERVLRLILNTPGGTMARPEVMERIRSLSQAAADDPSDERIRARLEWLMADPATVTDELVAIRRTIYARPGFAGSMRHILCLQDPDVRRRNLITDEELAAVPHGAMVVWTSNDPSGPAATGMDMAQKIRGGRFEHVTDAGHWPQWEQREKFNHLVLDFLAQPPHAGESPAEQAVRRLSAAQTDRTPCPPVRDLLPPDDLETAYAVQTTGIRARTGAGARIVGRKIGLTNPKVQAQLGVDRPDFGVLLDDMARRDGEPIDPEPLLQPRIEAELAFVLSADLSHAPVTEDDVAAATSHVVAALEIVDSRIAGWDIGIVDTIADNASSGLFVLGATPVPLAGLDVLAVQMQMTSAGDVVSTGTGADCLGNPLTAVAWLANIALGLGAPLRAGDVVLSGALGPMVPVTPGSTFTATITGVGDVTAVFAERAAREDRS